MQTSLEQKTPTGLVSQELQSGALSNVLGWDDIEMSCENALYSSRDSKLVEKTPGLLRLSKLIIRNLCKPLNPFLKTNFRFYPGFDVTPIFLVK